MKRTLIFALPLVLALAALGAAPASAEIGFSIFGGFRVGGLHFDIGLHHGGPAYRPGYFYRVHQPVPARGYRCGSACYRAPAGYYHHSSCPVVLHHFRAHSFAPPVFGPYGFHYDYRYRTYWDPGHGHRFYGGRYYWDHRYDRRFRGRSDHHHRHGWDHRHGSRYDRRYDGRWDGRWDGRYDRRWGGRYDGRYDSRRDRRWGGRSDDDSDSDRRWRDRYRGRAVPRPHD